MENDLKIRANGPIGKECRSAATKQEWLTRKLRRAHLLIGSFGMVHKEAPLSNYKHCNP